jgi:hypothetical protein
MSEISIPVSEPHQHRRVPIGADTLSCTPRCTVFSIEFGCWTFQPYVRRQRNSVLEVVTDVAHDHDVPVIVDAAAELPPTSNLLAFIEAGADLVAFSGGYLFIPRTVSALFRSLGCHRTVGTVFGYGSRGPLSPILNSDNNGCFSDTVFRVAAEVCEEFYDTLVVGS